MARKTYNKLVRDLIPEIIRANKGVPKTRSLSADDYKDALFEKFVEELAELKEAKNVEELADLLEVLLAMADALGIERNELESVRAEKARLRGAFKKRIFLEYVDEG